MKSALGQIYLVSHPTRPAPDHKPTPVGARGLGQDTEAANQRHGRTEWDSGMEGPGTGNGSKTENRREGALNRRLADNQLSVWSLPREHAHACKLLESSDALKYSLDLKLLSPEDVAFLNKLSNK